LGLGLLLVGPMQMGLFGAALAVSIPLALTNGVCIPLYACRVVKLSPIQYYRETLPGPLLASIPVFAVLIFARLVFAESMVASLLVGGGLMMLVLAPIYWFKVLPVTLRRAILERIAKLFSATPDMKTASANPREAE
ncbi:MAG TPA: hypothetical protein VNT79_16295, partial [Phycisphaerae bacterium]|nr:hypothetical protein [Phycisphaerae bacterium]